MRATGPRTNETGREKPKCDERHGAGGLPEADTRAPHREESFAEQSPGIGRGTPDSRGLLAVDGAGQLVPALGQHTGRQSGLPAIDRRRHRPLAFQFRAATVALVEMLFDAVLDFRRKLTVIIERNRFHYCIASHTKSPNTTRIFCVARNRQFLAASSLVPSTSPMARRRMP